MQVGTAKGQLQQSECQKCQMQGIIGSVMCAICDRMSRRRVKRGAESVIDNAKRCVRVGVSVMTCSTFVRIRRVVE